MNHADKPTGNRRQALRLKGYDYRQAGAYFVTICARDKVCLFGAIVDGEMRISDAGLIVQKAWNELPNRFSSLELDAFVVMPNHIHGIIVFVGAGLALPKKMGAASGAPTLGDVVRVFKSLSSLSVNRQLYRSGSIWQRNYYEHIIRGEEVLNRIREYIIGNPVKWASDRENPQAIKYESNDAWLV